MQNNDEKALKLREYIETIQSYSISSEHAKEEKKQICSCIKKALPALKKALKNCIEEDKASIFYYMAKCYEIQKNKAKALKYYAEASKIDKKYLLFLASFEYANNMQTKALEDYKQLLKYTTDERTIEMANMSIQTIEESIKFKRHMKETDKLLRFNIVDFFSFWSAALFLKFFPVLVVILGILIFAIPILLIYLLTKPV